MKHECASGIQKLSQKSNLVSDNYFLSKTFRKLYDFDALWSERLDPHNNIIKKLLYFLKVLICYVILWLLIFLQYFKRTIGVSSFTVLNSFYFVSIFILWKLIFINVNSLPSKYVSHLLFPSLNFLHIEKRGEMHMKHEDKK